MSAKRSDVPEYVTLNKASWDERAAAHAASAEYRVQQFLDDPNYLSDVVRFDLPLLGSISGQRGVHLQCHIGTDTLSLARLGASMTGFDFSAAALAEARVLVSADTDFGELLVRQGLALPTLVLFRQGNRGPEHQATTLLANLDEISEELRTGAIVVFTNDSIRIRRLPVE